MEPLDLSPRPGHYRPALYYWLAALSYAAYITPDNRLATVLNCLRRPWEAFADGRHGFTPVFRRGQAPWNTEFVEYVTGRVLAISCDNWIILAVCGTTDLVQLAAEVASAPDMAEVPGAGEANNFFVRHARGLYEAIWPRVLPRVANKRILFTGHSLGGACTQILAHLVRPTHGGQIAGVACLASPRVGNSEFVNAATWPVHRIEVQQDVIPNLPPEFRIQRVPSLRNLVEDSIFGYRHGGEEFILNNNGMLLSSRPEGLGLDSSRLDNPLVGQLIHLNPYNTHAPQNYILATRTRLPLDIQDAPDSQIDLVALDRICETLVTENPGWSWPFVSQNNYRPLRPRPTSGVNPEVQNVDVRTLPQSGGSSSGRSPGRAPRRGPMRY